MEEEILEEIEKEHQEETINEIVEIDENANTTMYDMKEVHDEAKKKKTKKVKKPSKWSMLEKKHKIIIIVSVVVVLLILIGVLLYFFVFKKNDPSEPKKPDEPVVIVEKDNYRYEDGKLIFVDKTKNDIGSYECKNKDENNCFVAYYSDEDTFDEELHVYENGDKIEDRSDLFNNRYAFVYDNEKSEAGSILLYDFKKEKEVGTYLLVKEVIDNKVIVKNEKDKYGIIDLSDEDIENVIDFKYDYLGCMSKKESIVAKSNLNYYLLDQSGKELTKSIPGEIKSYNEKYLSVLVDREYFIYDYKGVKASEQKYDFVTYVDDYVLAVDNKKIFAFDDEMHPLNKDGIKVNNTEYNVKVTFDKDKKQISKESAFAVSVTRDKLIFTIDEEEKSINVHEGKLSSKEEYISYFDGVLYIYQDKDKANLLGSYKCKNANVVDASSTEFTNCFIAKETVLLNRKDADTSKVGYLPIYNKRYVFIQDNDTAKTKDNIYLWDLKQNKQQANYSAVDTGFYNNETVVNFVDTASTMVLAKNTSDSLGVIRIENSALTSVISFKDNNKEIRYLKDKFLVKREDGTYHLYNEKGTDLVTTQIRNEIVDFNDSYVVVRTTEQYNIYSFAGKIVSTEETLIYAKLYDQFFVGVSHEKDVNIYTYTGSTLTKDEDTSLLVSDNMDNAFKVTVEGSSVTLEILDENKNVVKKVNATIGDE